jgi:hypothetical protein
MLGKALSRALLARGYQVIILTRSPKPASGNLQYAQWDIKAKTIDIGAVQQADHIIHLAGAGVVEKKWTAAYKREIIESRTESSRLIFETLKNNDNKTPTVVSASAIGWYGADHVPVHPFTENDPPDIGFLGEVCKQWESSIEPVTTLGNRLVKIRIGIVLSNEGGALAEFKKPLRFGTAAILSDGKQVISWIHVDDLCRIFIAAIENGQMQGTYNAVAPEPVTNKTLTLTLAKEMNGRFFIPVHVPAFVLKIMMGQRSIEVLKSATVSSKKITDTGFSFNYATIGSALKNLLKK